MSNVKNSKRNENSKSNNLNCIVNKGEYIFNKLKFWINKKKSLLFVVGLIIIDILLIIWSANDNYCNYVRTDDGVHLVGDTKNLLFGRNYIGLIITLFVYIYGLLVNKVMIKEKVSIKLLVVIFIMLFLFNMLLFYLFVNKVY